MRFAIAAVLALAGLRAQEMRFEHKDGERVLVAVSAVAHQGGASNSGLGFLAVDAQNVDGAPHRLRVEYSSYAWSPYDVGAGRTLDLGAGERARFFLPLPAISGSNLPVVVTVDGTEHRDSINARGKPHSVLVISDRPQLQPALLAVGQELWPAKRGDGVEIEAAIARDVPEDWRLFSAFDLVVVDGVGAAPANLQEALRRFAGAGGRVAVLGADRLPAGALRRALENADGYRVERTGLGALVAAPLDFEGRALRRVLADLGLEQAVLPMAAGLQVPQPIPGLDAAPVTVFLLVILVFAIAVGPVNLFWLRRSKKPLLALLTVPALGFGTTAGMIGFAILHDGFGVRGTVRSWTVLDQAAHEAAVVCTRTLFAGLTPGPLQLGDDALVLAPRAFARPDRSSRDRWHFAGEDGTLDGGALPARTPTVLLTARQGTARARLRGQVRADGALDLAGDGGVVPVGTVVVRGFDGGYWAGASPHLARCTEAEAKRLLRDRLSTEEQWVAGTDENGQAVVVDLLRAALDQGLRPGSYVAGVAAAEWLPEHGLVVDYSEARHHVLGFFALEDIAR